MKYLVKFFVIILITICTNLSIAEENKSIVYINMEKVMNESTAGKSLITQLEKIHKGNLKEFKKIEQEIKDEEKLILNQKNILSKDEYNKKISLFRKKFDSYKKNRQEKIESVSKKKVEATKKLLSELNPLLADYSKNNGISIILRKKDIVIAKTSLDISDEIIELLNSKIKKIKLN